MQVLLALPVIAVFAVFAVLAAATDGLHILPHFILNFSIAIHAIKCRSISIILSKKVRCFKAYRWLAIFARSDLLSFNGLRY
ncbi:hypothetical protein F5884DRAFT_769887 [Xylogone sp. PMI_703]|nr:hypothetical protein F5884DRAFT_769887 [Xylogone sp. PMI_703]